MLDTLTLKPLMCAMTQLGWVIGSGLTAPHIAYWLLKDANLGVVGAKHYGKLMNPDELYYLNAVARDYLKYKDTHWSLRRDRSMKINFRDWNQDYWIYDGNGDKFWILRESPLAVWCILNDMELR